MKYDVVIIGAGVVGLACAQRLAGKRSVLVIERHGSFGQETSSRNSEVIHAGMYYPPGSLKASLCVAGNTRLREWCEQHGVRHARVGKYIIATSPEEESQLDGILVRGRANGLVSLSPVTGAEVRREEPRVKATAGLWSPDSGIIDSHGFMTSLFHVAKERGADFAWRHRVIGVSGRYALDVAGPDGEQLTVEAERIVNAAGLQSDEIARLAGIEVPDYRLTYVKGHYFRLRKSPVRHLIYPVPPPALVGLGIHITVDLAGGARLGPDVQVLPDRTERYDVPESLAPKFLAAASRYLEGITLEDLSPDQAGIRPKLIGVGVRDFVIAEESSRGLPGWVNLIGIESPGLTCSLPIADRVAELLG